MTRASIEHHLAELRATQEHWRENEAPALLPEKRREVEAAFDRVLIEVKLLARHLGVLDPQPRRDGLDELTRESQAMGLYDE